MEIKAHPLQSFTESVIASSKQFFAFDQPTVTMPQAQTTLFSQQALANHYRVAVFFAGETNPVVGTITRQLAPKRFLLKAYRSNVTRFFDLASVTFIKRV